MCRCPADAVTSSQPNSNLTNTVPPSPPPPLAHQWGGGRRQTSNWGNRHLLNWGAVIWYSSDAMIHSLCENCLLKYMTPGHRSEISGIRDRLLQRPRSRPSRRPCTHVSSSISSSSAIATTTINAVAASLHQARQANNSDYVPCLFNYFFHPGSALLTSPIVCASRLSAPHLASD